MSLVPACRGKKVEKGGKETEHYVWSLRAGVERGWGGSQLLQHRLVLTNRDDKHDMKGEFYETRTS